MDDFHWNARGVLSSQPRSISFKRTIWSKLSGRIEICVVPPLTNGSVCLIGPGHGIVLGKTFSNATTALMNLFLLSLKISLADWEIGKTRATHQQKKTHRLAGNKSTKPPFKVSTLNASVAYEKWLNIYEI